MIRFLMIVVVLASIVIGLKYAFPKYPYTLGTDIASLRSEKYTIQGRKELNNLTIPINPSDISSHDTLSIKLNLNGLCMLPGKSSEISFVEKNGQSHSVSLIDYVQNCSSNDQTAVIPLNDFFKGPNPAEVNELKIQFWYPTTYQVDILAVDTYTQVLGIQTTKGRRPMKTPKPLLTSSPVVTIAPTIFIPPTLPTPTPTTSTWSIRSVSSMKETKDRICNQRDLAFIDQWVSAAKNLNITHIAVETPYDNPNCGNSLAYTKLWIDSIRRHNLKVWHRHMPISFEGIYSSTKNANTDYIAQIRDYIKANPSFFASGDIFTPIPEPQNGGINGVTYCSYNICIFNSKEHFNQWLRDAINASNSAFSEIGLGAEIETGYYGFDGFVAWGDNNPDWQGILEDSTIQLMGNITIDHYPELVGDTMENDLNELQSRYPNVPIIIGEWGTVTGGDIETQVNNSMKAAQRQNVKGFNYWHFGIGGEEALILDDLAHRPQFDEVQFYFNNQ